MSGADVVVAVRELDEETVRQVAAACDRLSARYVPWTDGDPDLSRPAVVVAGLPAGQRRVPPALMQLCTETRPGTPLLLLCQEGLVSPTVSLHGGQIVLVAPPFTAARLQNRLAVLHAEQTGDEPVSVVSAGFDAAANVVTRERLYGDVWLATISCRGLTGGAAFSPIAINGSDGLTAVLPIRPGAGLDEDQRQAAVAALHDEAPAAERLLRARSALSDAAVVHFDRRREEWLIAWPRSELPLWLHSDHRLPPRWNLGPGFATNPQRVLRAAPGDLLVGLTCVPDDDLAPLIDDSAVRRSGHTVLAALERRLEQLPRALGGFVIEVRP